MGLGVLKGSLIENQGVGDGVLRGSPPVKISPLDLRFARQNDEVGDVKRESGEGGVWSVSGKIDDQLGQKMEVDVKDLGSRMDVGPCGVNTGDENDWVDKQVCALP